MVADKDKTIRNALSARRNQVQWVFIYRVGGAWMYTFKALVHVQSLYKVRVCEYQPVPEGKTND